MLFIFASCGVKISPGIVQSKLASHCSDFAVFSNEAELIVSGEVSIEIFGALSTLIPMIGLHMPVVTLFGGHVRRLNAGNVVGVTQGMVPIVITSLVAHDIISLNKGSRFSLALNSS